MYKYKTERALVIDTPIKKGVDEYLFSVTANGMDCCCFKGKFYNKRSKIYVQEMVFKSHNNDQVLENTIFREVFNGLKKKFGIKICFNVEKITFSEKELLIAIGAIEEVDIEHIWSSVKIMVL